MLEYNADDICIYCGDNTTDSKVFDHDHYRNKYNGPAHSKCNLSPKAKGDPAIRAQYELRC